MNEQSPPAGPNEPGDRYAASMRSQTVASLTVPHFVFVAAPIELWSTFAQPEQRPIVKIEEDGTRLFIDAKLLEGTSVLLRKSDRERLAFYLNGHFPQGNSFRARESSEPGVWRYPRLWND